MRGVSIAIIILLISAAVSASVGGMQTQAAQRVQVNRDATIFTNVANLTIPMGESANVTLPSLTSPGSWARLGVSSNKIVQVAVIVGNRTLFQGSGKQVASTIAIEEDETYKVWISNLTRDQANVTASAQFMSSVSESVTVFQTVKPFQRLGLILALAFTAVAATISIIAGYRFVKEKRRKELEIKLIKKNLTEGIKKR